MVTNVMLNGFSTFFMLFAVYTRVSMEVRKLVSWFISPIYRTYPTYWYKVTVGDDKLPSYIGIIISHDLRVPMNQPVYDVYNPYDKSHLPLLKANMEPKHCHFWKMWFLFRYLEGKFSFKAVDFEVWFFKQPAWSSLLTLVLVCHQWFFSSRWGC